MRRLLALGVLGVCLASAGCGAFSAPTDPTLTHASSTPTSTDSTIGPMAYPDPPQTFTNVSARETAISYEEARLHNILRTMRGLEYFDIAYVIPSTATIRNRSDGGVYVVTEVHYAYGTEDVDADGVPVTSLYFVSETDIRYVAELECHEGPDGLCSDNV